jgi:hypothetical protein
MSCRGGTGKRGCRPLCCMLAGAARLSLPCRHRVLMGMQARVSRAVYYFQHLHSQVVGRCVQQTPPAMAVCWAGKRVTAVVSTTKCVGSPWLCYAPGLTGMSSAVCTHMLEAGLDIVALPEQSTALGLYCPCLCCGQVRCITCHLQ